MKEVGFLGYAVYVLHGNSQQEEERGLQGKFFPPSERKKKRGYCFGKCKRFFFHIQPHTIHCKLNGR